jgi:hypothetical protein
MWAAIGIVLLAATAHAQAPSWPYRLEWEHDGASITHFDLCVGSSCQMLAATRAQGTNTWSAPLPVLAQGFHTLAVYACNSTTCAQGIPTLSLDVQPGAVVAPTPGAPTSPTTPTPPGRRAPPRRPPKP